jgi:hypothetical protein
MKTLGILGLCGAVTLTGCSGDPHAGPAEAGAAIGIAAAVMVVGGGLAISEAAENANDRFHFAPGLNVKAPESVGHGRKFEVKVAIADAKAKPLVGQWNFGRAPDVSFLSADGASEATLVNSEVKREWYIARYKVPHPGQYRVTVKAPVPGAAAGAPSEDAEVLRELVVK